jgi:hypothetical protein
MDNDMVVGLDKLSAKINADFCKFMGNLKEGDYDRNKARIREFNSKLQFKIGKKYIKFTTDKSVWGFVVLQDDDKFFRGDILKPAGHSAPARNFARGNILNGQFGSIQWMGAA